MNTCIYLFSVSIIASIITQTRMTHLWTARPKCFDKIVRIISTTITTRSGTFAMRGSEIELQCGTDSASTAQWNLTNRDHNRVYVQTNGNLQIKNIQPDDDDGWYQCVVKFESVAPSIGGTFNNINHHIEVFEAPSLCQTISWKYVLLECNQSLEAAYRNWALNQLLNERTHPLMELKHFKIQCMLIEESLWELQIEIYLGFTFSTIRTGNMYAEFATTCPMVDVIDNLQNKLRQFTGVDQFQRLEFLSYTFSNKLMSFCPTGFHVQFNVCILCPTGQYSTFPAIECQVCKEGFYNDQRGASQCYLCPKGTTNSIRGATSVSQCEEPPWLTGLWYGMVIVPSVIGWAFALGIFMKRRRSTKKKKEKIQRDIDKRDKEPSVDLITPKEFIVKKDESDKHLNEALTALNKDKYLEDNKPSAAKIPMYVRPPFELPKEAQVTRKIVGNEESQQQKEPNYENINYYSPVVKEETPQLTSNENIYETINYDSTKVPESSSPLTDGNNENIYENVNYSTQVPPTESTPGVKTNENANHYSTTANKQLTNFDQNSHGNVDENINTKGSATALQQHANTGETNRINQYVNVPPMSPARKANNSQLKKQSYSNVIAPPLHEKPPITLSTEDNKRKQMHPIDENALF